MNGIGYSCWYSVLSRHPVNNVMSVLLLFPITGLLNCYFCSSMKNQILMHLLEGQLLFLEFH